MKYLYYLYYKIYKTYSRVHKLIKLYHGPRHHTDNFIALFLLSIPLWVTLKLRLWQYGMAVQFVLTLLLMVLYFGIGFFVEKKIRTKAIGRYLKETPAQSVTGAFLVNVFLIMYAFFWIYLLQ